MSAKRAGNASAAERQAAGTSHFSAARSIQSTWAIWPSRERPKRRFQLDRVYLHSRCAIRRTSRASDLPPFEHRFAMVALACAGDPRFVASLAESGRNGDGPRVFYSVDTVRRFRERVQPARRPSIFHPGRRLVPGNCEHGRITRRCWACAISSWPAGPGFRTDALRQVIPPQLLAPAPRGASRCGRRARSRCCTDGLPAGTRREPRLRHRACAAGWSRADHTRTCASARGGIHYQAGSVSVTSETLRPELRWAIEAAQNKKAAGVTLLDLDRPRRLHRCTFCSAPDSAPRRSEAICDAIEEALQRARSAPHSSRRARGRGMAAARLRRLHRAHLQRAPAGVLRSRAAVARWRAASTSPSPSGSAAAATLPQQEAGCVSDSAHRFGWRSIRLRSTCWSWRARSPTLPPPCSSPAKAAPARINCARLIHELGPRRDAPYLKIDCASLPQELVESELFGHERGAFTGAVERKLGRLEMAGERHHRAGRSGRAFPGDASRSCCACSKSADSSGWAAPKR